ncbi:hypothetical protein DN536_36205 [Burkholderia multivorans]|nr:hypothetical protein DN536_36205 [Burkholderia multivorans]
MTLAATPEHIRTDAAILTRTSLLRYDAFASMPAAEAVRDEVARSAPDLPAVARAVLELAERVSPIPMREYAGRHFSRHERQTLAMFDGWIPRAPEHAALTEIADGLRAKLAY